MDIETLIWIIVTALGVLVALVLTAAALGDRRRRRRTALAVELRRDAEAVAVLLGKVHHEALRDHRVEQVVRRAPRQLAVPGDPLQRRRVGLGGEEPEHPQGAGGGRDLGHLRRIGAPSDPERGQVARCVPPSGRSGR